MGYKLVYTESLWVGYYEISHIITNRISFGDTLSIMVDGCMKKLHLLLFSLLVSFNSFAKWTEIPVINDDFTEQAFIDFDNLNKKKDGYVYWWMMTSRSDSSKKIYLQSDCEGERFYPLSAVLHTEPLGRGESSSISPNEGWTYPPPDTGMYNLLEVICEIADEATEQRTKSVENLLMSLEYKKKINDLYENETN